VLAISDVPGDRLEAIGSGPCAADPTTFEDAQAVIARHGLGRVLPERVRRHLERGCRGEVPETAGPGDAALARVTTTVVARNADARAAIVRAGGPGGDAALDLGEVLAGEARPAGRRLAALGRAVAATGRPRLIVAGGETVVTLRGSGSGGRSQELALAAAIELARKPDVPVRLLAAGTDGRDGPTDAAGGVVDARSVSRARDAAGLDAAACLGANDSHRFLDACGGLVRTGPTGTNVMDLVLLIAGDPERALLAG